jgi:hypothetical protein
MKKKRKIRKVKKKSNFEKKIEKTMEKYQKKIVGKNHCGLLL